MIFIVLPMHSEGRRKRNHMVKLVQREFPKAKVIKIYDKYSKGKGWAVRKGFDRALRLSKNNNDLFAYIDGDGDIHPMNLHGLLAAIKHCDIAVGKKKLRHMLFFRRIITFFSRIYIHRKFKLNIDTQTGIKLFRKYALFLVEENGFLFDVLMLKKAMNNIEKCQILEVPVEAHVRKNISIMALIDAFKISRKISSNYNLRCFLF